MKRVGFIGLGTMGAAMARNLMRAGFALFVYNRTAERMKPLATEGAKACASPADVGKNSELVVTCVSDAPDVREVILGTNGIAAGMQSGGIIVDCSTSSPGLAREMETILTEKGIDILDAPVSGGPEGAKNGTLSIMVGGDESVFQRALPALQAMGKTITHIGPAGAGQTTKAINQILTALHMEAIAEGITLAKKCGLDPNKIFQAVSSGAATSWILQHRGPLMIEEKFSPPNFTLSLHAKDLRIAMETAKAVQAQLPLAEQIHSIMQSSIQAGWERLDHSAIYLYSKKINSK